MNNDSNAPALKNNNHEPFTSLKEKTSQRDTLSGKAREEEERHRGKEEEGKAEEKLQLQLQLQLQPRASPPFWHHAEAGATAEQLFVCFSLFFNFF